MTTRAMLLTLAGILLFCGGCGAPSADGNSWQRYRKWRAEWWADPQNRARAGAALGMLAAQNQRNFEAQEARNRAAYREIAKGTYYPARGTPTNPVKLSSAEMGTIRDQDGTRYRVTGSESGIHGNVLRVVDDAGTQWLIKPTPTTSTTGRVILEQR